MALIPPNPAANKPLELPKEFHDFRDTGDPMEKNYPLNDWRSWEKRPDPKEGK